jgi:hypothetical protein
MKMNIHRWEEKKEKEKKIFALLDHHKKEK